LTRRSTIPISASRSTIPTRDDEVPAYRPD
jgi:hypothetical protein